MLKCLLSIESFGADNGAGIGLLSLVAVKVATGWQPVWCRKLCSFTLLGLSSISFYVRFDVGFRMWRAFKKTTSKNFSCCLRFFDQEQVLWQLISCCVSWAGAGGGGRSCRWRLHGCRKCRTEFVARVGGRLNPGHNTMSSGTGSEGRVGAIDLAKRSISSRSYARSVSATVPSGDLLLKKLSQGNGTVIPRCRSRSVYDISSSTIL